MVSFVPPSRSDTAVPVFSEWRRTVVRLVLLLIFAGMLNSALTLLT
jgi:hypothetical protein